jgi:hypothetical protein
LNTSEREEGRGRESKGKGRKKNPHKTMFSSLKPYIQKNLFPTDVVLFFWAQQFLSPNSSQNYSFSTKLSTLGFTNRMTSSDSHKMKRYCLHGLTWLAGLSSETSNVFSPLETILESS